MLDTERKTRAIERGSDDGEHDERAVISRLDHRLRERTHGAQRCQNTDSNQRKKSSQRDCTSRGGKRSFQRNQCEPDHGEGRDAARTNRH